MDLILISGLQEVERGNLIEVVLSRYWRSENIKYIDFDRLESMEHDFNNSTLKEVHEAPDKIFEELEGMLSRELRGTGDCVIINSHLTVNSEKYGFIPLINDKFLKILQPGLFILVETPPEEITGIPERIKSLSEQQGVNRIYASRYSSVVGSPLKVIELHRTSINSTIKEFNNLIAMVKGGRE